MFLNFKNEHELVYREEGKYKLNTAIFFSDIIPQEKKNQEK